MRSEFEKNRYWIGLFKTDVEFNGSLGEFGRYELNGSRDVNHSYLEAFNGKWEAYAKAWNHRQTEVDELQKRVDSVIHQAKEFIQSCKDDADIFEDKYQAKVAYGAEAVVELLEQAIKGGGE